MPNLLLVLMSDGSFFTSFLELKLQTWHCVSQSINEGYLLARFKTGQNRKQFGKESIDPSDFE